MTIIHKDDYDLVDQYLNDDENAGEKLYFQVMDKLRKYICKNTNTSSLSESEKEDILSETLLISVERLKRYNGESSFLTFVVGICKNIIMRKYSQHMKQAKIISIDQFESEEDVTLFEEIIADDQPNKNPLKVLLEKEEVQLIHEALGLLSQDHQQIIRLRIFNRTPVKVIAALSGENIAAIDSLYRRAIENFKKAYKKRGL